ncbi:MAG TPA: hypothetical protein VE396_08275 [Xanthobacteraceae bacterium]|jgi:hypothetical protein|nr:hypothetical protein [Xanthobacteraceae bacterium]
MVERLKVGFDEPLRGWLEEAATAHGTSLADEVRVRVLQTLQVDRSMPKQNRALLNAVAALMDYTERQTGWPWHAHPFAFDVLRHAIATLLDRVHPPEEPAGDPPRKPVRLVASTDPKEIGKGLETLAANSPDAQFRPDASIAVTDTAPIRHLLEIQKKDEEAIQKVRRRGKRG